MLFRNKFLNLRRAWTNTKANSGHLSLRIIFWRRSARSHLNTYGPSGGLPGARRTLVFGTFCLAGTTAKHLPLTDSAFIGLVSHPLTIMLPISLAASGWLDGIAVTICCDDPEDPQSSDIALGPHHDQCSRVSSSSLVTQFMSISDYSAHPDIRLSIAKCFRSRSTKSIARRTRITDLDRS